MTATRPIVEARRLSTHFGGGPGGFLRLFGAEAPVLRAVDGVDLVVEPGQVVGLVGESGSGKSTLGRTILGLERPAQGEVRFAGEDLGALDAPALRRMRRRMQMIPQDSAASLSPRLRVFQLFEEVYDIRDTPRNARRSTAELLAMVELGAEHAGKYPHELSGGQAKRVSIARALAMEPEFIVADEPTSGLDVSAVAAIVNLLARLRSELNLSYLLITHDLDVVAYMADVIAVMYLGKVVEIGPAEDLAERPLHPYTRLLLEAVRRPGEERRSRLGIRGDVPSPRFPPPGCRFHTRCPFAQPLCREQEPPLDEGAAAGHRTACHFWRDIASGSLPAGR
jgi:oligopeptide/dipeptide ABC transporter ATP-binding protein